MHPSATEQTLKTFNAEQLVANWCIPEETGRFLKWLALTLRARTVLEIGTSIGYSGLWWLSAIGQHPDARLYTIDANQARQQQALTRFTQAGMADKVTLYTGEALTILDTLSLPPLDIVFLDAHKADYVHYFTHAQRLLKSGGIIVADNTTSHAHAIQPFFEAVRLSGMPFTELPEVGSGLWLITCF